MQTLGNFCTSDGAQAFIFAVVAFDSVTRQPSFALIQESPTDVPIVYWNGTAIETRGLLADCTVTCNRPNDGGGILRRTCTLSIQTEHAKGYPFFKNVLTKGFFYGGQPSTSFYFGIYSIDRQLMFQDLTLGLFLGYFQVDAGLTWTEKDGCTKIPLLDMLLNDSTVAGATDENIPEYFFIYNPWFTGTVIPKVYGQIPRVKMLNSFPSINTNKVAGTITGLIQANYTAAMTAGDHLLLETNSDTSSALKQLATLGGIARIKVGNNEVIAGVLTYDAGTNSVYLDVTERNSYYAQCLGYTDPSDSETPNDWGFVAGDIQKHPVAWSDKTTILLNAKDIVQDPNGYIRANVQYFVSPGTWPFEVSAAKLGGWADQNKGIIKSSYFNQATVSGLQASGSVNFSANPSDGNTITISDGTTSVTFEFDNNSSVGFGNIPVTIGLSTALTADALRTAINANAFNVSAAGTVSNVTLANDATGTAGNVAITKVGSAITVTGMAGGVNGSGGTNQTLLSFRFTSGPFASPAPGTPDPVYTGWPGLPYMYFAGTAITVDLFYIDPYSTLTGGSIGDHWSLVGFTASGASFECFLRNGFSKFDATHVYCEGEGRLIQIPTEHILSVDQDATFHGVTHLARVLLDAAPLDMGIGATSNAVYTDAIYRDGTNENRTETIIYQILKDSPILYLMAGDNINGTALEAVQWCPYIGYIANGDDSVSQIIDRICFQIGATFKWLGSTFWLRTLAKMSIVKHFDETVGEVVSHRIKFICPYTDKREMIENSAELNFGKIQTAINSDGLEYIPLYFDVQFGGWQDPFYKAQTHTITKAMKPNERKVSYKFNLINDLDSAVNGMLRFLAIGHPSATSSIQRTFKTEMTMHGCRWEACDPIVLRDFPLLTTVDETNAEVDDVGDVSYPDTTDKKPYLTGALACVDTVEYQFNIIDPKVVLTCRQSQPFVIADGGPGGGIGNPGAPNPPDPPPPPTEPPGNNNKGHGGPSTGGGCMDPLGLIISGGGSVTIDDATDKTVNFSVDVDTTMGCRGGAWIAEIIDELHTGGAAITSVIGGSVADKVSDSYTFSPVTVTVAINNTWLLPSRTSRECQVKFTFNSSNADGSIYSDVQIKTISVDLAPLIDITES